MTAGLETGRTHQIRVHLSAIGHPVVGDEVYGQGRSLPGATLDRPVPPRLLAGLRPPGDRRSGCRGPRSCPTTWPAQLALLSA